MLLAAAAGLLCAAAGVLLRWALRRTDGLGRARPAPVVSVVLLSLAAVGAVVPVARHRTLEHRLAAAAGSLVGAPVTVSCQSAGGAFVDAGNDAGYVRWGADGRPEHRTLIKHAQCSDLRRYVDGGHRSPSPAQVIAVHVLTHEAMHMAGQTSELAAECEAVQRDARTARALGASDADARRLARTYWLVDYPSMPEDYRTPACAEGGSLDERLPDAPWRPLR